MALSFELVIINELKELRRMSEWLQNACGSMNLPKPLSLNLDLCANEAVANIILNAYQDHNSHEIHLCLERKQGDVVCLTIQDDGIAFNPFETLPPVPFDTLENAKIGGLGIHLIRTIMDECNYLRFKDKNIITLCANIIRTSVSPVHCELLDI